MEREDDSAPIINLFLSAIPAGNRHTSGVPLLIVNTPVFNSVHENKQVIVVVYHSRKYRH